MILSYKEIIKQVSEELNIPEEVIDIAYKSYWGFIKNTIEALPLKEDNIAEEQFSKFRTNFNVPSLGKLNCTYSRLMGIKERYNKMKNGRL